MNSVTPKAAAKHDLSFNKQAFGLFKNKGQTKYFLIALYFTFNLFLFSLSLLLFFPFSLKQRQYYNKLILEFYPLFLF
jgi:hypothetical protein